jgi:hypothetical protein
MLPICEKIPYEKSCLNILNCNQDIDYLIFSEFLTVHGYLMIFGDANFTVHNLVRKESKCVGIHRLSLTIYEVKAFNYFFTVRNNSVLI